MIKIAVPKLFYTLNYTEKSLDSPWDKVVPVEDSELEFDWEDSPHDVGNVSSMWSVENGVSSASFQPVEQVESCRPIRRGGSGPKVLWSIAGSQTMSSLWITNIYSFFLLGPKNCLGAPVIPTVTPSPSVTICNSLSLYIISHNPVRD